MAGEAEDERRRRRDCVRARRQLPRPAVQRRGGVTLRGDPARPGHGAPPRLQWGEREQARLGRVPLLPPGLVLRRDGHRLRRVPRQPVDRRVPRAAQRRRQRARRGARAGRAVEELGGGRAQQLAAALLRAPQQGGDVPLPHHGPEGQPVGDQRRLRHAAAARRLAPVAPDGPRRDGWHEADALDLRPGLLRAVPALRDRIRHAQGRRGFHAGSLDAAEGGAPDAFQSGDATADCAADHRREACVRAAVPRCHLEAAQRQVGALRQAHLSLVRLSQRHLADLPHSVPLLERPRRHLQRCAATALHPCTPQRHALVDRRHVLLCEPSDHDVAAAAAGGHADAPQQVFMARHGRDHLMPPPLGRDAVEVQCRDHRRALCYPGVRLGVGVVALSAGLIQVLASNGSVGAHGAEDGGAERAPLHDHVLLLLLDDVRLAVGGLHGNQQHELLQLERDFPILVRTRPGRLQHLQSGSVEHRHFAHTIHHQPGYRVPRQPPRGQPTPRAVRHWSAVGVGGSLAHRAPQCADRDDEHHVLRGARGAGGGVAATIP
mmetsp:Transcript_14953/g.35603  ORF Transcript_14953/g.35603 Transcript_14953/m.35603 type:complete len:547 (-) Transcript_14953:469-2109(-)